MFKNALKLLDKSLNIKTFIAQEHMKNFDILILISQVWLKCKEFDKALKSLTKVL